jgi:hypothetical protein
MVESPAGVYCAPKGLTACPLVSTVRPAIPVVHSTHVWWSCSQGSSPGGGVKTHQLNTSLTES